jgi:tetratricopeptide (TPR) repeat protein
MQKLLTDFSDTPLVLLSYQMQQETYLAGQQFDQALAAGEEVLERDPNNFPALLRQAKAYLGLGQMEPAFAFARRADALVQGLETSSPPAGASPQVWEEEKQRQGPGARDQMAALAYELVGKANEQPDLATRVMWLERFLGLFPESNYRESALMNLALAYQQQGEGSRAKMLDAAEKALTLSGSNVWMMLLLADALGEKGERLDRVEELSTKALQILGDPAEPARPVGSAQEQWTAQRQVWEGLAHFSLGEARFHQERFEEAIQEFRAADPLLAPQPLLRARTLYWLGYAYAKAKQFASARTVLNELLKMNSPFQAPAQTLLDQVSRAQGR